MINQAMQIIVIRTSGWDTFRAKVTLYEKRDGIWHIINDNITAVIGKNGLGWGAGIEPELYALAPYAPQKIEGDGRSPAGIFPLKRSFGFSDAAPCTGLEYIKIGPTIECVDDIGSCYYNRIVDREKIGNIDWQSSERMYSLAGYSMGLVIEYNTCPVEKGRGSCIFLHIWDGPDRGTKGCTAISKEDMADLFSWLDLSNAPYLFQFPEEVFEKIRMLYGLP